MNNCYDEGLNKQQQEAVLCTEGPLLILAGAGSGKTRVLTHRIAYLIEEKGVNPWNILAITFTNKAAKEMKDRVERTVSFGADSIWVSTFHSTCVRILRRHGDKLGYGNNFSIYDTDDQKIIMKQVFKTLDIDTKYYKERAVMDYISKAKDKLISPEEFEKNAAEFRDKKIALIYKTYQEELRRNNAMDFDDLIVNTADLFVRCPEILTYYQERFRYILVDEYQDTNFAQFKMIELLAAKDKNLCVVGDDDQSIYKFRGADITNILNFESSFPGAKVVKLEQNYRSTQNILKAANEVISNNRKRKKKTLWTANREGSFLQYYSFDTGEMEADFIVRTLCRQKENGRDWKEMSVLYRTNAQSRLLEEACIKNNVPYLLVGGVNFYQRKEIKDVLAYLKTIANGIDDLAVARIINVPKRKIGAVTIGKMTAYAMDHDLHLFDVVKTAAKVPGLGNAAQKVIAFADQMEELSRFSKDPQHNIGELIEEILKKTGYQAELEEEGDAEAAERLENIQELVSKAVSYSNDTEQPSLDEFLELIALVADVDRMDDSSSKVTLMTMHSAKGLEFPFVVMAGMEDGLFPSMLAVSSEDPEAVEEERRLCYVGITRAMEELILTSARVRMINGENRFSQVSRFVKEIPEKYLEIRQTEHARIRWDISGQKEDFQSSIPPFRETKQIKNKVSSFKPETSYGDSFGKTFSVIKPSHLDYQEGDRVCHSKFGEGTVRQIKDGAKDYEVTVCFDKAGIKRMFASFARLKKIGNEPE